MGLSIHYRGRIRDYAEIVTLVKEVEDVCIGLDWVCQVFETDKSLLKPGETADRYCPYDVKGVAITPPECEPVFLTFLPDGTLCSPVKLIFYDPEVNDLMIEVVHTKTQFAGPEIHIALIKLLRYLTNKYFESFQLDDEGYYWETGDKQVLAGRFGTYNSLLGSLSAAMKNIETVPGESAESLADRVEKILKNKFGEDTMS